MHAVTARREEWLDQAVHPEPSNRVVSDCSIHVLPQLLVLWNKSWRNIVVLRRLARSALVHDLPVMMPATPLNVAVSITSTHDAFISVPMHPRNDSGKGRSIARDTISDKGVGRLRGMRIAFQRSSRSFFILAAILVAILDSGLLLLWCPSHNFLPLAGACICPLCHCGQVVSRTGLV